MHIFTVFCLIPVSPTSGKKFYYYSKLLYVILRPGLYPHLTVDHMEALCMLSEAHLKEGSRFIYIIVSARSNGLCVLQREAVITLQNILDSVFLK